MQIEIQSQEQMETFILIHARALVNRGENEVDALLEGIHTYGKLSILRDIYNILDMNEIDYARSLIRSLRDA